MELPEQLSNSDGPPYFDILKDGDIIQRYDEFSPPDKAQWWGTCRTGDVLGLHTFGKYRRFNCDFFNF